MQSVSTQVRVYVPVSGWSQHYCVDTDNCQNNIPHFKVLKQSMEFHSPEHHQLLWYVFLGRASAQHMVPGGESFSYQWSE